jgi:uncharacterized membrane protein
VGLAVVIAGFALVILGSAGQANVSAGGFILVGPFPIVFGTGSNGGQLALLSILAGLVLIVLTALWAKRFFSPRGGTA